MAGMSEHRTANVTPVFIIGPVRCGASLLSLSLGQHPGVLPVMENAWFEQFAMGIGRSYSEAVRAKATSQLDIARIESDAFFAHFGQAALALMTPAIVREPQPGTSVILLDATPANAFLAAPLRMLFPNAKFIHVVRDVREVVAVLTSHEPRSPYKSRQIRCSEREAYDHWLKTENACVEAERAFGSDVVLRVLRDELIARPEATIGRCLEYLDLPFDERCLRAFSSVSPDVCAIAKAASVPIQDDAFSTVRAAAILLSGLLTREGHPQIAPDPLAVWGLQSAAWKAWTRGSLIVPPIPGCYHPSRTAKPKQEPSAAKIAANGAQPPARATKRFVADLTRRLARRR